jgi:hypothetical protein
VPISDLPWNYFVSYAHSRGFGSIEIKSSVPATSYDTVKEFTQTIARTSNLPVYEIVVLNFILLSGPDQDTTDSRPSLSEGGPDA